jgi:hypothetical protein
MKTLEIAAKRPSRLMNPTVVYLAIVHSEDGVRFATAAPSASALTGRVLDYIRPRVSDRLWPSDVERFNCLLAQDDRELAVELYFAAVGRRWDCEWLWTEETEI